MSPCTTIARGLVACSTIPRRQLPRREFVADQDKERAQEVLAAQCKAAPWAADLAAPMHAVVSEGSLAESARSERRAAQAFR